MDLSKMSRNAIDLSKMSKNTIILGIINLTTKFNELKNLQGSEYTHKVPSANTLRSKSRKCLIDMFNNEWEWVSGTIRDHYEVMDIDIDKGTLDEYKAIIKQKHMENQNAFDVVLYGCAEDVNKAFKEFVATLDTHMDLSGRFPDVDLNNLIAVINSDENISIVIADNVSRLEYYHRSGIIGEATKEDKDIINLGTIGSFDMDSVRGQQQMLLMTIAGRLNNKTIRKVFNNILETVHEHNNKRIHNKAQINEAMLSGFDDILAPYINGVAMGVIK